LKQDYYIYLDSDNNNITIFKERAYTQATHLP